MSYLEDVSVLYKDEYEIGLWALSYIKKKDRYNFRYRRSQLYRITSC